MRQECGGLKSWRRSGAKPSGDFALIYLAPNPSVKLNLAGFGGRVSGVWIDLRTGRRAAAGKWEPRPGIELKASGPGDWLLLLRRRGG